MRTESRFLPVACGYCHNTSLMASCPAASIYRELSYLLLRLWRSRTKDDAKAQKEAVQQWALPEQCNVPNL
ncbi:hypothetical protein BDZ94DRAFT_1258455 [Collybia nuda]|uniref:Uncharacterized protein n=1 Tax=Collybia nuda TaxID=64659 RepID=A0A9P6CK65_9AGAR|nr:hypothetical protein BDZ94DRAFT_1258455 [Collybia nuda]